MLSTDASQTAVGAVLQQYGNDQLQQLCFFSKRLQVAQTRYSTFGRELLAIYLAIKHFCHVLEGRHFVVLTDHKPLVYAFRAKPDRHSPREARQLDFIGQFTTDIRYLKGSLNKAADALSRMHIGSISDTCFNLRALASAQSTDDELNDCRFSSSLQLRDMFFPGCDQPIICDFSATNPRPFIPQPLRRAIFNQVHNLSHPSVRATRKLISTRYVLPSMNQDISRWAKECLPCQRSKVHRHTVSPTGHFPPNPARFGHIHIDIVGPLPICHGFTYIFTCVDRFTRWPVAVPVVDTQTQTIAQALLSSWIANFGTPATITTDRGAQFQSALFRELTRYLGVHHIRTTAYHPSANGLVERFHRQLKASIMARDNTASWSDALPHR